MYIADLHIHSRYSRATSTEGTPEHLDLWARRKGIQLVGTGDFTHPAWREELREKLIPAEEGFYRLKEEYLIDDAIAGEPMSPRFVVTGEISSIYKKNGKVRKVHSLILLPGLEAADQLSDRLNAIGNIHSDGRPILGLDCRDLLEITLEVCPEAVYIPAHIWTPHFSLFGAFSGFDSIEECFGDLTGHIHALETGLSSDPPMNWRLSALDSYQLISNSDAHSPSKLGREANLFDSPLSYPSLSRAIQTGDGLGGTIEFFPEEGKYHYDGHRKCRLCLSPLEAEQYKGICPVCGRKLTTGVLHRVEQLADREEFSPESIRERCLREKPAPADVRPFENLVPLPEVIAASTGHSAAGRQVQEQYFSMLRGLGPEFAILRDIPVEQIRKFAGHLTALGIERLRQGKVERTPGYDGEYGRIKLFDRSVIDNPDGQLALFTEEELRQLSPAPEKNSLPHRLPAQATPASSGREDAAAPVRFSPNEGQLQAITAVSPAVAVIAGPGTGKTATLVSRILHLMHKRGVKPSEITAVTFTNRAADEMRERLKALSGEKRLSGLLHIGTFHSLCHQLLALSGEELLLADESETVDIAQDVITRFDLSVKPLHFLREISLRKTGLPGQSAQIPAEAAEAYQQGLEQAGVMDFDDLLLKALALLSSEEGKKLAKNQFHYILVDEFQDINPVQYDLIRAFHHLGRELFVIGDPNQSIYGFRGSDSRCFSRLAQDYPNLRTIALTENYRSMPEILRASAAVIAKNEPDTPFLTPMRGGCSPVRIVDAPSDLSAAIYIAKQINRLVGGIDMLDSETSSRQEDRGPGSFADIAVLYRTHRQAALLEKCLSQEGIPFVVAGKDDFLTEKYVRGTLCFFRWLINPQDSLSLRLCLKLLWDLPQDACPLGLLSEKYLPLVRKTKPQKLLESWAADLSLSGHDGLKKLAQMSVFSKTIPDFLSTLSFGGEADLKRAPVKAYASDAVTLMTLHASKGLEYASVFLYGLKKGTLPLEIGTTPPDLHEERRLFYVGLTRARDNLCLLTVPEPSPFLADIPEEYVVREQTGRQATPAQAEQLSLFDLL